MDSVEFSAPLTFFMSIMFIIPWVMFGLAIATLILVRRLIAGQRALSDRLDAIERLMQNRQP